MIRPIKGYEGLYSITSHGRIYSHRNNIFRKPSYDTDGYLILTFKVNGSVSKMNRVHRLVAFEFINNPLNKPQINHIDGNKENNNIDNLEWCTAKENAIHAINNKLWDMKKAQESNEKRKSLTNRQVKEIREKYKYRVYSYRELAKEYKTTMGVVWQIVNRITYKEVL